MKKKEVQNESSVKIALRLKAFEREEKMIKVLDSNKIALTDEKTGNSEEFEYDRIFDMRQHNSDIFSFVKASTVGRIFDNTNCCVMCIGQAGSGKSFTLFGNDARFGMGSFTTDYSKSDKNVGLVIKVYHGLINSAMDFQDNKEYQILVSMMEVHKENVRDLLSGFEHLSKDKMNAPPTEERPRQSLENLEVYESANGQLMIKNLSSLHVDSEDDLIYMIAYGLRVRLSNSKAMGYNFPNSHVIMNMNFVLRDKENYNFPSLNATVQFVEIACHERLSGSLGDQKKFQDSLYFNSQISALQKVLLGIFENKKLLPYKDSKLTKVIQNCCNSNSEVVIVNHAISNPREFIPCLSYLNLVSRFRSERKDKGLVEEVQRIAGEVKGEHVANSLTAGEEKVVKKLKEDIRELDTRYQYMKKEYKGNLVEIGNIIGIGEKEKMENLIYKTNDTFWTDFRQKKQVLARVSQKDQQLNEKDIIIIKTQRKIEELKREISEKLELHIVQTYQAQDELNYLRDQIKIQLNNKQEFDRENFGHKYDKVRQLAQHNQALLKDKNDIIAKFPKEHLKHVEPPRGQTADSIKQAAFQAQKARNEEQLKRLKSQCEQLVETKQKEYEQVLALKNEEADQFNQKCLEKKKRKKKLERELEQELVQLYGFLKKQSKIVYNIRNDAYSSGLETINIPTEDIDRLHLPMREAYPHLYRTLDKIKISESKQESVVGLKKEETLASMAEEIRQNLTKTMQQQPPADPKAAGESKPQEEPSLMDLTGADLGKFDRKGQTELFRKMVKQIELQKLRIETLRKSEPNSIAEVQAILEDAKFYEGKLKRQQQVNRQTRGVIDSQARLLAKDGSKL